MRKCEGGELTDGVLHAGRDDVIIRLVLLKNQPHALNVILRVAPVTEGIEVAELEVVLETTGDTAGCERDLTGDEVVTAALGLVVEEDTVAGEDAVGVTILTHHPEAVLLRNGVRTERMERSRLGLRNRLDLTEKLGSRCLVNAAGLVETCGVYGLEDTKHTECIDVTGVLGGLEGHLYMGLRREVVDLVRLHLKHDTDDAGGVGKIALMDDQPIEDVVDPLGRGNRRTTDDAMDLVALLQQKLCKIGTILTCDTCN